LGAVTAITRSSFLRSFARSLMRLSFCTSATGSLCRRQHPVRITQTCCKMSLRHYEGLKGHKGHKGPGSFNLAERQRITPGVGTPVARNPRHRPGRAVFPHPVRRSYSLIKQARGLMQTPVRVSKKRRFPRPGRSCEALRNDLERDIFRPGAATMPNLDYLRFLDLERITLDHITPQAGPEPMSTAMNGPLIPLRPRSSFRPPEVEALAGPACRCNLPPAKASTSGCGRTATGRNDDQGPATSPRGRWSAQRTLRGTVFA